MKIDFEKVLADYGLKAGDKVNIKDYKYNPCTIVEECHCLAGYVLVDTNGWCLDRDYLFREWEKVESKKKFGDLICRNIACYGCPLRCINCKGDNSNSIREKWIGNLKINPQLEPMRDYIEKELDKEVE